MRMTTPPASDRHMPRPLIVAAVGYQWFYNGANFLAFKVAANALHPLMVATLRYVFAALILLPIALLRLRKTPVSMRQVGGAALVGMIMLVFSQALTIWGTHFLPAGVAAIFSSSSPIFLALFAWGLFRRPLTGRQVAGVGIGFVGLASMGWASAAGGDFRPVGAALVLFASASWAAGSLLAPRLPLPRDPAISLTVQLVTAAIVIGTVVSLSGIAGATRLARVPAEAWIALSFVVLASTVVGYAVFLMLNAQVSSALANTFYYAAPVVALGLSALVLGEPLTLAKMASAAIALLGVALMIGRRAPGPQRASHLVEAGGTISAQRA